MGTFILAMLVIVAVIYCGKNIALFQTKKDLVREILFNRFLGEGESEEDAEGERKRRVELTK